ncbi:MAG: hypothetical protein GF414_04400 [Candidatus Altiarchaeales archaeon]|nr:hypothetical protein [Candidatus Altiarchaeales archaeon]
MRNVLFGALEKIPVTVMQGIASLLAKQGVTLLDGPNPKTDTKGTVWAPTIPEGASPEEQVKFLTNVAHEAAHMAGRSSISEAQAVCGKKKLPFQMINAVDDVRIEKLQEQEYQGLKKYYEQDYTIFQQEQAQKIAAAPKSYFEKLHAAMRYMIIKTRCDLLGIALTAKLHPDTQKLYDEVFADLEDDIKAQTTHEESIKLGMKIYGRVKDAVKKEQEEQQKKKQAQQQKQQSQGEGEGDPQESDGSDSEDSESDDEKKSKDKKKSKGKKDADKDELTPEQKEQAQKDAQGILDDLESEADGLTTLQDDVGADIKSKSEACDGPYMVAPDVKDYIDTVTPNPYTGTTFRDQGIQILGSAGHHMTSLFVTNHEDEDFLYRPEGDLDMQALVEDYLDVSTDVFMEQIEGAQDWAAVSFLLDQSSSMRSRYKIGIATSILSAMVYYLDKVGIPSEVIGYNLPVLSGSQSGKWRDRPIRLNIFKTFDEPYAGAVMNRLCPQCDGGTPDLDALKFIVPRLWARPEKRKVLMVLCDGKPEIGNRNLQYKLERDEVAYIKAVKRAGIKVFGFGIHADLSKYYGADFVYVDTNTLGSAIVQKMKQVLNSVA